MCAGEARLTPSPANSDGASRSHAAHAAQRAADRSPTAAATRQPEAAPDSTAPPPAKRRRLSVAPKLQQALGAADSTPVSGTTGIRAAVPGVALPSQPLTPLQPSQQRPAEASQAAASAARPVPVDDASWLSRLPTPAAARPAADADVAGAAPASIGSLLSRLPRRHHSQRRSPTPAAAVGTSGCVAAAADTPGALVAMATTSPAAGTCPGDSRLHSMVMAHLRAQHEAACAAAANPVSTLAPISLLEPHVLPEVSSSLALPRLDERLTQLQMQ